MSTTVIDGAAIAQQVRAEVARDVEVLQRDRGVVPGLAVVLVGDDPASAIYVRNKRLACEQAGMFSQVFALPSATIETEMLKLVAEINLDPSFHGVLIQLPLPSHIDENTVMQAMDPAKDIDGLHPYNVGLLAQGRPDFVPGTPAGIQQLLLRNGFIKTFCIGIKKISIPSQ